MGANYNDAIYRVILKLSEEVRTNEELRIPLAKFILDYSFPVMDSYSFSTQYGLDEHFYMKADTVHVNSVFELLDKFEIYDSIKDLIVSSYIQDDISLVEELVQFNSIFASENIPTSEILDLKTFAEMADTFGCSELSDLLSFFSEYETLSATDKDPQQAIADFYIARSADNTHDVLLPFGFKVDSKQSLINFMPEAVDTSVQIQGMDGDIVQDTVYSSRAMDIVCYSEDGLTRQQKEQLKTKLANTINTIKNGHKKITIGSASTSFDVKYSGLATTTEGASYLKLSLPLKASNPYSYSEFEKTAETSGLLVNDGIVPVGARFEVVGPTQNVSISLGNQLMKWTGTVKSGETLIIDCDFYTVTLVDESGVKHNAMDKFNNTFVKIPLTGIVLELHPDIEGKTTVYWREMFLWGTSRETF